jgi:ribA/ribD-fused uncharacterized protein
MIDSFTGKYRFLSNFAPSKVDYFGDEYPTVEHAYQAAKTSDPQEREKVRLCKTPGEAKRMGRTITLRKDWEERKIEIMYMLCNHKFSDPLFAAALLETGTEELVEGNNWGDKFWGKVNGEGENWLGKILMQIREEIK